MTDKQDNVNRDMAVRSTAINMAIAAQCGLCHDPEGRVVYDPEEIVKAAKAFENYIKGEISIEKEPFIEGVSNHLNNPATKFKPLNDNKPKEAW